MTQLLSCRRTFVAVLAILCLTYLGSERPLDVSTSIAAVAIGIAGANAYEAKKNG